jgi:hypothetical protein
MKVDAWVFAKITILFNSLAMYKVRRIRGITGTAGGCLIFPKIM